MRRENMVGSRKRRGWMSFASGRRLNRHGSEGFTLIEALVSVAIIGIVMGPIFFFLLQVQKRFQGNSVVSEANQGARSAMAAIAQEIGQAGFNPQFTASPTTSPTTETIASNPDPQCVTLTTTAGINPGDYLSVDTGSEFEQVKVLATSSAQVSGYTSLKNSVSHTPPPCTPGANQISAVFLQCHNNSVSPCPAGGSSGAISFMSDKFPFPSGILQGQSVTYNGSSVSLSTDHILAMFYGGTDNSGTLYYVVYSLYNPTSSSPTSVAVNGSVYKLYTLWRSVDTVNYATGQTASHAYPLVDNVVYQDITGATPVGPTGQKLFTYITTQVTVVPNIVSVVGTVVININVAVNPQNLEYRNEVTISGTQYPVAQYFTMSSQIRPVNLWAAVNINQTGGSTFLPPMPVGLPMSFPSTMAGYYF